MCHSSKIKLSFSSFWSFSTHTFSGFKCTSAYGSKCKQWPPCLFLFDSELSMMPLLLLVCTCRLFRTQSDSGYIYKIMKNRMQFKTKTDPMRRLSHYMQIWFTKILTALQPWPKPLRNSMPVDSVTETFIWLPIQPKHKEMPVDLSGACLMNHHDLYDGQSWHTFFKLLKSRQWTMTQFGPQTKQNITVCLLDASSHFTLVLFDIQETKRKTHILCLL